MPIVMQVERLRRRSRARERAIRLACLGVALASAAGLFLVAPSSASATSTVPVTVTWAGDTSSASAYQPTRSTGNVHYNSLKNISVTVGQTTGIQNQAIPVSVTGFAATRPASAYTGTIYTDAMNFMQAMECWGDPSSPTFYETCMWGGRYGPRNGLGSSVYDDNLIRVPTADIAPPRFGTSRPSPDPLDVPFVAVDNTVTTGHQDQGATSNASPSYPLFNFFGVSTTNEVESVRMDATGSASFDFEAQNSDKAPEMGCGTAGHLRCWLVLVPRDTIYGGHDSTCSEIIDQNYEPYTYGRPNSIQAGNPINPHCDYWNNRMVVPLDFNATGNNCASGNAERGILGSQLLVGAMSSWQPALCADLKTTYSFQTNPDAVARAQLVEQQPNAGMAFGSYPVTASELTDTDKAALSTTLLSYAPIAATSAVFAYIAEGSQGRITTLTMSPRLVAKLLTQSYKFSAPSNSSDPTSDFLHLPAVNRGYELWSQDPDFQALNPDWRQFTTNPAIVLPGPAGADAIAELWKWIDADSAATAWLAGAPDPYGMKVNPYYLPKGDPNAVVPTFTPQGALISGVMAPVGLINLDGSPMQFGVVAQNKFIKGDNTLIPLALVDADNHATVRYPFGSNQFAPYAVDFQSAARSAFRADPGSQTLWDDQQVNAAGDKGAWISGGPQIPGQRFTIAFTDDASAKLYDLSTAALTGDNSTAAAVGPTDTAVSAALSTALGATSDPGVQQIDPSRAGAGAYPLTALVYATVNLTSSDGSSRTDYANFIKQVTTTGQVPGVQIGQLPPGYVPLTSDLAGRAAAAATAIATFVPLTGTTPAGSSRSTFSGGGGGGSGGSDGGVPSSAGTGTISPTDATAATKTPSSPAPGGQSALLISLGTGIAGSLFAPVLLRRRRIT